MYIASLALSSVPVSLGAIKPSTTVVVVAAPTISNVASGLVVPMPTFTASAFVPPNMRLLLVATFELYPIATDFVKLLTVASACEPK